MQQVLGLQLAEYYSRDFSIATNQVHKGQWDNVDQISNAPLKLQTLERAGNLNQSSALNSKPESMHPP